jgi:hypothetical protein
VMRLEETKEPGALGEVGKQRPIIARQPAIEGPVAHTGGVSNVDIDGNNIL